MESAPGVQMPKRAHRGPCEKKCPRGPCAQKVPPVSLRRSPVALLSRVDPGGTFCARYDGEPFPLQDPGGRVTTSSQVSFSTGPHVDSFSRLRCRCRSQRGPTPPPLPHPPTPPSQPRIATFLANRISTTFRKFRKLPVKPGEFACTRHKIPENSRF